MSAADTVTTDAGAVRASDIAIDVHGLTKSFNGRPVVRNLSMRVKRGTIYGFLGPNGSGKTTTIRMLTGLLTPDEGEGTCLGYDIRTQADQIKRHVGYMTQRFSLYQDLSVRENLEFVARLFGLRDPRGAAQAMIERLGLKGREDQLAGELSGGWKQRLALGACTLPNPQLLLLDEPTAGVDPKARREFWNEIHALAAEGLTVLVSTHYMDEAERCHEIAYIAYGNLLVHGTVEEVIAASHLTTYEVSAVNREDLMKLSEELAQQPGVDMVAPFGNSLHVSGRDEAALEAAIAPYRSRPGLTWKKTEPSLEDVFIDLMNRSQDNFQ
jgi:ABC-2 type transport system ATP-binding protein